MKKQILSNLGSNYISKILAIGMAFFIVPFLTKKLSKELYGITVLAEAMILFFSIISNSLKVAMTRFATYALSNGKKDDFISYLSSGRFLLIVSAALILILGGAVSCFYPYAIKINPAYLNETKFLFFLVVAGFCITIPNTVFAAVIYAKQRPDLVNLTVSVAAVLRGVLIFFVYSVSSTRSMLPYGWIYLATNVVQNGCVYFLYQKLMPNIRIQLACFNKQKAREILTFATHTSVSHLSELLYDNTALVIIGFLWGPVSVAVYSISIRMAMTMKRLFMEAAWTLIPTFIDLAARRDLKRMEHLFIFYTKAMSIINTPICIVLIFMAKPLMLFWVGKDFLPAAALLPFHVIPLFMAIPFAVCSCMTYAYAKVKVPGFVSLIVAVLNIFLGLLFGVVFSGGLYGIAIGAALSSVLYLTAFLPYYVCKVSGISLKKYFYDSFLKPFVLACVVMGAGFWIVGALGLELKISVSTLFILGGLFLISVLLAIVFVLDGYERSDLRDVMKIIFSMGLKPKLSRIWEPAEVTISKA